MRALLLLLVVVPSLAAAQRRTTIQVQAGGAITGAEDAYATNGGPFARLGVTVPFGPEASIEFAGAGFLNPQSTDCPPFTGTRCRPDFPNILGGSASLVIPLGDMYAAHPISLAVGAGTYHLTTEGADNGMSFGGELGAQMLATRGTKVSIVLDARVIIIPNTDRGRLWLTPLTIGLRF